VAPFVLIVNSCYTVGTSGEASLINVEVGEAGQRYLAPLNLTLTIRGLTPEVVQRMEPVNTINNMEEELWLH